MSKSKKQSYGKMQAQIEKIAAEMEREKERMACVMTKALLTDSTAAKLGDCSDADLRRIMSMLAGHVDECIEALRAEKQS